MFNEEARREIERVAIARGWNSAALLAVADVESGGRAFAIVNDRPEPLIRFEGHYFDRRLSGAKRAAARKAGLANPVAGKVKNPTTQAARWRMFNQAAAIDRKAAIESTSWGIGQVMGAHWSALGYGSAEDLVLDARNGVYGQVRLMANYVDTFGLADALNKLDWKAFSRGYNGPNYAAGGYDKKCAAAYQRYSKLPPLPADAGKRPQEPASAQTPSAAPKPSPAPKHAPASSPESNRGNPEKVSTSKRFWTWLLTAVGTPLAAFGALDWRVQLAIVAVIVGFAVYAIQSMPAVRRHLGLG